ncbi:MAG: hypothetical protein E7174_01355 [Firmicutes bacterium]|nr:hypothetical protein [Bacillota bacterium]
MEEQYQVPEENQLTEAEMLKQRNVANNANNVRNLADVARRAPNPYARAAGTAVKAADKLTGGRSSQALGKTLNKVNKFAPGGLLANKTMNKINQNGTSNRISNALSKKKSSMPFASKSNMKGNAVAPGKENSFLDRREVEDQTTDGGEVNLKFTAKFLKIAIPTLASVITLVIFVGIFMIPSMAVESLFGIGSADEVPNSKMEDKLSNVKEDDLKETDSEVQTFDYDLFIEDETTKFRNSKLKKISKIREYNEADIDELEDYYPYISSYIDDEGNNMNTVYTFFFKLRYIYLYYNNRHKVELDMPLLMSTLTVQEKDMNIVFKQNIEGYGYSKVEKREDYFNGTYENTYNYKSTFEFSYNYKSSQDNSKYDIEVLAQNMVSQIPYNAEDEANTCTKETAKDGMCDKYKIDYEKYDKFLETFLAEKYSINDESQVMSLIVQIYDVKEQYEDLVGDYNESIIYSASNSSFWWPIGSAETEEIDGVLYAKGQPQVKKITSYFRGNEKFRTSPHTGIDIGNGGNGPGVINIIAVKPGTVIYATDNHKDDGFVGNTAGYANYIKIQHSDGTYTLYAHLAHNSATVKVGEVVDQGQVIAKMGNSGNSSGTHLHFEVRLGAGSMSDCVNPLEYVDPENPRPMSYGSGNNFSLTTTTLSKEEFVAKMNDYYKRSINKDFSEDFYKNFVLNAEEIYDVSLANNVNPELVVVTAGTEQNWGLDPACQYTNNYWGIGIANGKGCNSGGKYSSLSEGIIAYANVLKSYSEFGKHAQTITNRYNERLSAGCDSGGYGLPGTLEGMQSLYSWIGDYRYNPGNWGLGGCEYLNLIYGESYCSSVPACPEEVYIDNTDNCPVESKTTVCEQSDYTALQIKDKVQKRYDIFGL